GVSGLRRDDDGQAAVGGGADVVVLDVIAVVASIGVGAGHADVAGRGDVLAGILGLDMKGRIYLGAGEVVGFFVGGVEGKPDAVEDEAVIGPGRNPAQRDGHGRVVVVDVTLEQSVIGIAIAGAGGDVAEGVVTDGDRGSRAGAVVQRIGGGRGVGDVIEILL